MQDLDKPEEALLLTERLVEVQHIHSQLAKQAEQRTTLLSKVCISLKSTGSSLKQSNLSTFEKCSHTGRSLPRFI